MNRGPQILVVCLFLIVGAGGAFFFLANEKDEPVGPLVTDRTVGPVKTIDVEPDQGTATAFGKVAVALPKGSVSEPAELSLARGVANSPKGAEFLGSPVSVSLSEPLKKTATLDLPPPKGRHARAIPGYFDPGTGEWMVVDEFQTKKHSIRVKTSHFTLFGILRFLGVRAAPPKCEKPFGGKVVTVVAPGGPNQMLFACANRNADGSATLRVVNNRSYLMPIEFPRGTKVGVPFGTDLAESEFQAIAKAGMSALPDTTVLVPPGAQVEVRVPVGAAPYSIKPRPNQGIAGIGLIRDVLAEFDLEAGAVGDILSCSYRAGILLKGSAGFNGGEVIHLLDECTTKVLDEVAGGKKKIQLAKAALKGLLIVEAMAVVHDAKVDQVGAELAQILVKPPRPAVESWKLSAVGIGPIRLGMNESEARAVAPGLVSTPAQFCDIWEVPGLDNVNFGVPPKGLRSIGLIQNSGHGPAGVETGTSVSTMKAKLGSRLTHEPADVGSLFYDFYYIYSPTRETAIQFVVNLKTRKVLFVSAGYPGEFYFPDGTELCA